MLDPSHSRARQQRLLKTMAERKLDAVVIGLPQHVYYFSARRSFWLHEAAFVLLADGRSWMTSGNAPAEGAAVDEAISFEASWLGTQRQEQPAVVAAQVVELLKSRRAREVGIDSSAVTSQLAVMLEGRVEPIDPALWQLRRIKDPDELALMRRAAACADAMYARARQIVQPGVPEIDVFAELHAAAVRTAGEPMTALLGNDYACGVGGGPPRGGRAAQAGEIYILDVGPTYRGYFADASRGIAVDRNPTDAQMNAWHALAGALKLVEQLAKPGARCRDIYEAVSAHLQDQAGVRLPHHLGHGVGLQPHEYPHLNPKWDDALSAGETFTAEPGLYAPQLAGGLRLENLYVVTPAGVESLITAPLELA